MPVQPALAVAPTNDAPCRAYDCHARAMTPEPPGIAVTDDTVVLVAGGLSGIGRETALAFASRGAKIVISAEVETEGGDLERELRELGSDVVFISADVRKEEEVRNLVDETLGRFGHLDIAINNAGAGGRPGGVCNQNADSYAAAFETSVLGTLLSLKHQVRALHQRGRGSIINIACGSGHPGGTAFSLLAASKHAVEGLTKSVALEVAGTGIRVNALSRAPTPDDKLDHLGRDFARAILFLASDEAALVTGRIFTVGPGRGPRVVR